MINRMITIKVNGIEDYTVCKEVPTLEELQAAVGGLIEAIPHFTEYKGNRCVALCNEEGKLRNMPYNLTATKLWLEAMKVTAIDDHLVGDIVILVGDDAFLANL